MRCCLSLLLFLTLVPASFGQAPSVKPAPSASPQRRRDFGWSLERYKKRRQRDAQSERKSGGASDEASDEEVIRVRTDLVVSDVLVTNQKGNVIVGLRRDDFIVTEDGVPQTISTFSSGENASTRRSVVLIIDCGISQGPYMKKSIEAAKVLVDKLAPQDKMAVVTNDLKLRLDFTQDKSLLKTTLDSFSADWRRNDEFGSLLAVLNEMFDEEDRRRIVILLSDGVQVMWLKPDKEHPYPVSYSTLYKSGLRWIRRDEFLKYRFGDVKEAIERSGATIYSVIPGVRFYGLSRDEQLAQAKIAIAEVHRFHRWTREGALPAVIRHQQYAEAEASTAGQTAMFRVAELSGGFADFLERPEDAENVSANIFTVINNRYLIGYTPTNRQRDGRRREVKIEVRGHPEYLVTGRKAYYLEQ